MQRLRKNKSNIKLMAICTILVFSATAFSAGLPKSRLIPDGKVFLYSGTQKIGEYHSEAPLPENTLLSVQGQCGVKLDNAYLVATDKSLFSIRTDAASQILAIDRGTIYFALSATSLSFQTSDKVITTDKIILNASSDHGLLKGYISVADGTTKIGVLEGGSMILTVDDGKPIMIKSAQELLLAQADLFDIPEEAGEEAATEPAPETAAEAGTEAETAAEAGAVGGISTKTIVIGLGILGLGAAAAGGGGGGGGGSSSPSTP